MGWGGFSIGALRRLEQSIKHRELERLCKYYEMTHDVGLAMYSWWKMIPVIQIVAKDFYVETNSIIWHAPVRYKPDKQYDVIMMDLYARAAAYHSENNMKTKSNKHNISASVFDDAVHAQYERHLGREYANVLTLRSQLGYKSTFHHQRRSAIQHVYEYFNLYQYSNETMNKLSTVIPDIRNFSQFESSLYNFKEGCHEDKEYFDLWKNKSGWALRSTARDSEEYKMCLEYYISVKAEAVNKAQYDMNAIVDSIFK